VEVAWIAKTIELLVLADIYDACSALVHMPNFCRQDCFIALERQQTHLSLDSRETCPSMSELTIQTEGQSGLVACKKTSIAKAGKSVDWSMVERVL
jgi:hypothetical protein